MNINIVLTEEDIECIKNYIDYGDYIDYGGCNIEDILIEITTQADNRKKKEHIHVYQKYGTIPECISCIFCGKIKPE